MSTLEDLAQKADRQGAQLTTVVTYLETLFAPEVASSWDFSEDDADADISYNDSDYGALITTLILTSAGPVRLAEVAWTISFTDGRGDLRAASFPEVLASLQERGLLDGRDFDIFNYTAGGGARSAGRKQLAVLPYPLARTLTEFRVDMTWESVVTLARTTKEVHLSPRANPPLPGRRGLPPVRTIWEVQAARKSHSDRPERARPAEDNGPALN